MKINILSSIANRFMYLFRCIDPTIDEIIFRREFKLNNDVTISNKNVKKTLNISREVINNIIRNNYYIQSFKKVLRYNEPSKTKTSLEGKPFVSYENNLDYLKTTRATAKIKEYIHFMNFYLFDNSKRDLLVDLEGYKDLKQIIEEALSNLFFDICISPLTVEASEYGKYLVLKDYDEIFMVKSDKTGINYVINYYQCGLFLVLRIVREMLILDHKEDLRIN